MDWIFLLVLLIFIKIKFFPKKKIIKREEIIKEEVVVIEEEKEILPYYKKKHLLTYRENKFFRVLEEVIGEQYYIFPQVNLDKIVSIENNYSYDYTYRNKINRKSVDFVLFDKQSILPILVIELDDSTHQRESRKERDIFVNKVFEKCDILILHINSILEKEELEKQILLKVQ
ncbi:DUF2726 domain-containing protein [Patescibacteria group bacterium]|nr:DUF2726 domain-containing protein [Patescibacteria group bacterium]